MFFFFLFLKLFFPPPPPCEFLFECLKITEAIATTAEHQLPDIRLSVGCLLILLMLSVWRTYCLPTRSVYRKFVRYNFRFCFVAMFVVVYSQDDPPHSSSLLADAVKPKTKEALRTATVLSVTLDRIIFWRKELFVHHFSGSSETTFSSSSRVRHVTRTNCGEFKCTTFVFFPVESRLYNNKYGSSDSDFQVGATSITANS